MERVAAILNDALGNDVDATNPLPISDTKEITIVDTGSSPTEYYGFAVPGTATSAASWRIQRKSVSGSVTSYLYADGDADYDNIWDNRAALSYS